MSSGEPAHDGTAVSEGLAPVRSWADASLDPDASAALVVEAMTLDEKFSWLSGPMAIPFGPYAKPDGALGSAGFFPPIARLGILARQ